MSSVPKFSLAIVTAGVGVAISASLMLGAHSSASAALMQQARSDTIVKMAGAPRYPGVATLVAEITIVPSATAAAAGDVGGFPFTLSAYVFPLRDGTIAVVDASNGGTPVRIFGTDGAFVRTVGRLSNEPGAYVSPSAVSQLPDGRILVRDVAGITAFGTESTGTELYRSLGFGRGGMVVGADGSVFAHFTPRANRAPGSGVPRTAVLRLRGDGTGADTIQLPELTGRIVTATSEDRLSTAGTGRQIKFTPRTFWVESPLGYFITGSTGRYAIDLRIPRATGRPMSPTDWTPGDTVVSIRRDVPPVAVLAEERAVERSSVEQSMRARDPNWQWTGDDVPEFKPPIEGVVVGLDGTIWVGLSTPSEIGPLGTIPFTSASARVGGRASGSAGSRGGRGGALMGPTFSAPVLMDVYEPDGSYKGQVAVPENIRITSRTGDKAWGVTLRSDNVYVVQRYRIVWQ